ncbi:MAG: Tn3 family transposase [Thermotogota bacterium]|nr:Tn3 family transposase [Thermotogota bacterium]
MSAGKRISILSKDEEKYLYEIPDLTNDERMVLFDLSDEDLKEISKLPDEPVRINYILQLGYFRATNYLFNFTFQKVSQDVWFIINNYFPEVPFPKKRISKHHHYDNQKRILKHHKFKPFSSKGRIQLERQAKKIAKRHVYPRFIFDELNSFCQQLNMVRPSYSRMQTIVSDAFLKERDRAIKKVGLHLDKRAKKELDALLETDDNFYQITLLKKDPKDFSTSEMRSEVSKKQRLLRIYTLTQSAISKLKISSKNLEYYADMAIFYPPFNLKRFNPKNQSRLYLLCYANQRYYKVNDNLTTFFSYRTNKFYQDGEIDAKDKIEQESEEAEERYQKAKRMIKLFSNRKLTADDLRPNAFQIVPEEKIDQFAEDLTPNESKKTRLIWQYLEKQNRSISLNLRPVFRAIDFNCGDNEHMSKAVEFLKTQIESNRTPKHFPVQDVPMEFIPKIQRKYVIEKISDLNDKRRKIVLVNSHRYEYMVYRRLNKMIESGQVYVNDSINYRKLEDDLIPYEYWLRNREKILSQLNLSILNKPIEDLLNKLDKKLVERYREVNKSIKTGKNKHVKLDKNKNKEVTWRLPYKKQDDAVNNPFYENFSNSNIADVVRYAIESTGFDKKFKHIQPYYSKSEIDTNNLIAVLIANGAGFGVRRMAEISDITENELASTNHNFFSLKTLREANDNVVNKIARLPIFKFYTLSEYGIHASVDGQKVITRNHTIKARYSKKYFGLGKGLVSIKLVANNVPINDKLIGANEYEGHYLFDLVYNNSTDIDIFAVSGDMHSINRVNFALMYMFGYRFMPRFTKLPEKARENLVSFQNPNKWGKNIIKPKHKVKETLIKQEWDNILRILASLAMKETTQSIVVRKLSSYKRSNPTLKALIEFDKIIMSLYMLDYIDDPEMRSNVHRSLNRGESLHQLISAIRKISDKKLSGKNEVEMEMHNECNRLIANCIIYYNAVLLSDLHTKYIKIGDQEMVELIKRLSPVAWRHVNLIGKYEFCLNQQIINIQEVINSVLTNSEIDFAT